MAGCGFGARRGMRYGQVPSIYRGQECSLCLQHLVGVFVLHIYGSKVDDKDDGYVV